MASDDEFDLVAGAMLAIEQDKADAKSGRKGRRTVAGRLAREKKPLAPNDGRLRRAPGRSERTAQLNATIYQELKERTVRAARDHRMTMVEIVEGALSAYLDTLDKHGGGHA
jgi:hypothetical protein